MLIFMGLYFLKYLLLFHSLENKLNNHLWKFYNVLWTMVGVEDLGMKRTSLLLASVMFKDQ